MSIISKYNIAKNLLQTKNLFSHAKSLYSIDLTIMFNHFMRKNIYMFSYFVGNGEDGLHLAYSYDGLKWEALNNNQSVLKPTVGKDKLMRDPSIAQGKDGTFHLVWTTGWWDKHIGYASSEDLVNWPEQKSIPVMYHEPTTKNCWAPEVFTTRKTICFILFGHRQYPANFRKFPHRKAKRG